MSVKKRLRFLSVFTVLLLAPFVFFDRPGTWLSFQDTAASTGTCCKSDSSLCIIPPHMIPHRYAMMPNIPCPPAADPPDDET